MAGNLGIVQTLLTTLGCTELKEILAVWGYKSQLEDINQTVTTIKSVLVDAESKVLSNEAREYIHELKDEIYKANDLFDEFLTLLELNKLQKSSSKRYEFFQKVRRFFSSDKNQISYAYRMFHRVKKIKKKLNAIADDRKKLCDVLPEGGSEEEERPILGEEIQDEQQNNSSETEAEGNNNSPVVSVVSNNLLDRNITAKRSGKKVILKWVFIVLNIIIELCQAIISQLKNQGKMGRHLYLQLSIITSSICLTVALVEAFREGVEYRVVWKKRGRCCCWFYYPGDRGQLFGSFWLYFGLISSVTQLTVNLTENLIIKRNIVQFDYIPLLLAVCYFGAAIIGSREKKPPTRCGVHPGDGAIDPESGLFHCPQCHGQIEMVLT